MKTLLTTAIAILIGLVSSVAERPKIGCIAEVGDPAGNGRNWALVFLKFINGATPAGAYRIYWKSGAPSSGSPYALISTIQATKDPTTLVHLTGQATDAGVDMMAFEKQLDGMIGDGVAAGETLAEKLAYVVQAESDTGLIEFQRESLASSHPLMAVALGRAYLGTVPAGTSTFEIRTTGDAVVGRTTIGASPEYLPAPDGLTERVEPAQRGHLRVQLDWCYGQPLRQKFLHWGGTTVFRAKRQEWIDEFGGPPPVNVSRAVLMAAVDNGHASQVNRLPVQAGVVPDCPPDPLLFDPMFTDDNDSVAVSQLEGGAKFVAGDEYTYWVVERDLLDRPGHPSAGAEVIICDRIAPNPPLGLTVTNQRRFSAGAAEDFLRLEWPAADRSEVLQWYVYCSDNFDDVMAEYKNDPGDPESTSHLETVPNDGSYETSDGRIIFDHDASVGDVRDLGKTVYYRLRAEDDTPCKTNDLGNISGPSGPVPAARHDLVGPTSVGGRLGSNCCHIEVSYEESDGDREFQFTAKLIGMRPTGSNFHWVEFFDVTRNSAIGRYQFTTGQDSITVDYQAGDGSPLILSARFGHHGGYISPWRETDAADSSPYNTHTFNPRWNCVTPAPAQGGCVGLHLPTNPSNGTVNDVCLILTPNADVKSWVTYVQFGINAKKVKFDSGTIATPGPVEICYNAFPPTGGELCFYAQGFDAGGNPGPMEPLGCIKIAPKYGLPIPAFKSGAPLTDVIPGADPNRYRLDWICAPGAELFDVAFSPAPEGSELRFLEFEPSGIIREWGTIHTDRIPTAFGANQPEFSDGFNLIKGVGYIAKIRSVTGFGDGRDEGNWSERFDLHWLNQPPVIGEVPWPMRDSPGITGSALMEWDKDESVLRVEIGEIPTASLSQILKADSIDPYLFYDLPLVAYLQDTTPGGEGRFLQVTHRFDEILVEKFAGDGLRIIDESIMILPEPSANGSRLWLRIDQAVMSGKSYRVHLVMHETNGEIREVLRTNEISFPQLLELAD